MDQTSLAAGAPEWLARYPRLAMVDSKPDWSADSIGLNFRTGDRAPQVIAFYKDQLARSGFTVDDNPSSGTMLGIGGGVQKHLRAERSKDGKTVTFELMALEVDTTMTMVSGTWTRTP